MKKLIRRLIRKKLVIISLFALLLAGCNTNSDIVKLKLAHGLDINHPVHKAMEFMARRVKEKSHGKLLISIYPNQQLGTERECLELLQIGSLAMTKVSASVLESFSPLYKVLSMPYLFRNDEHRFKILDGEIGKELLKSSETSLIRGLCYYDAGSRSFYTKDKLIKTPNDLKGMKIRVMQSATAVKMVNLLGGSATPIASGELYTALQQGVVDGAENNFPTFYATKHYEICKYFSVDEHASIPDVLVISTKVWNKLSLQMKKWLTEAINESVAYQKKLWKEATIRAMEKVKEAGVQIYYPDKKPFIEKVQPLYDEYKNEQEIYDLIKRIKEIK